MSKWLLICVAVACTLVQGIARAEEPLEVVRDVAIQPLGEQVRQLTEALEFLGNALSAEEQGKLQAALRQADEAKALADIQAVLDPHCLIGVHINPESRVKVVPGPAKPSLVEQGWRQFLVKVHNEAGVTAELKAESPNALRLHNAPPDTVRDRWLEMQLFNARPMNRNLSGLALEYRIIQLYSRDAGQRSARISFNVGQGTQDIGFRNDLAILFTAEPGISVKLQLLDEHARPTTAGLIIRDRQGRTYPSQAKRLAPDFAFHPQIYRADGETVTLPAGKYTVEITRGPEYLPLKQSLEVQGNGPDRLEAQLKRWIDPSQHGYWSGDHHIHAAGCAHYTNPTEGVHAPDMYRHILGEDLKVGANLTWGPCFDYQKQFFTGAVDKVSQHPYLLRYDVEVSGFGSHKSGHLCLLRLKEQMYPGGDSMHHWPTLGLSTLRWAKKQGAVTGPAHSGWGLEVKTSQLPNYEIPPFNGIGANEYIVDVTHEVPGPDGKNVPAVDFISTVDTPYVWELNIWYHTLNCGFRTRISGETDFPCIYQERVGLGRSYVKLDDKLDYDAWCEGIRQGRNYASDGRSHIMNFQFNGKEMGVDGSEVKMDAPGAGRVTANVAAYLPVEADEQIGKLPYTRAPYWHIERARVGASRKVKLELLVNGMAVDSREITADGALNDVAFENVKIDRSSWVALRILPSSHTNPIFVLVGDKPIRASRESARWCLASVDQCWDQKSRNAYARQELDEARAAYEHARRVYRQIAQESDQP